MLVCGGLSRTFFVGLVLAELWLGWVLVSGFCGLGGRFVCGAPVKMHKYPLHGNLVSVAQSGPVV